jgi:hypothetical protein
MSFSLAPLHCRSLQLTEQGLVLGEGVVVAPLERRADGSSVLAVEGRDAEIFALLSLAQGRAISPNILHGLRGVAKRFAQGDIVGGAFRLALFGLPPLRGPRDSEMLKTGATFLARGFSPWAILREAGIEGPAVELCKAQWDENLHPRDPATGRFIEIGSGTVVTASAARALIAAGATQISAGAFALAGGALLSLTAAGWVLSHGPKGKIEDGPSYWLPGVAENSRDSAPVGPEAVSSGAEDRMQRCEDLYRIDTDTCRAIDRRRGARSGAACYASARKDTRLV